MKLTPNIPSNFVIKHTSFTHPPQKKTVYGDQRENFAAKIVTFRRALLSHSRLDLANHGNVQEINPLNAELNPICHLLALLGAHHILHVSRIRVKTRS